MYNKKKFYLLAFAFGIFMGILTAVLTSNWFWLIFHIFNTLFWVFIIKKIRGF